MSARLEIGRIGKAHGLRGEVRVAASSNRAERFEPGSVMYADGRHVVVSTARLQGQHWIVRFEGVDGRDAAEALRGLVLTGDPLGPLPDGEVWVHDLVGCVVVDRQERAAGRVVAVIANPAHDLLELESGALVPMVFVVEQEPGRIVIDPPDGLLDLSATAPSATASDGGEAIGGEAIDGEAIDGED
jgi:16S rRNA processing protein RimM